MTVRYPAMIAASVLLAALAFGLPAAAQQQQTANRLAAQQNDLWAQQQAADQRAIAQRNELEALDARVQTEAHLRALRAQGQPIDAADPVYAPTPAPEPVPLAQLSPEFPSMPDADLAASRARILAASANRH